jgi:hypothetical protein
MLVPRFTIRTVLAVMAAGAVLSLLMGMAYRGQTWAWGVILGVLSMAVTAAVHAAGFCVVWCFARLSDGKREDVP